MGSQLVPIGFPVDSCFGFSVSVSLAVFILLNGETFVNIIYYFDLMLM